jgi:AcrR family transcriptional regulator
MGLERTAVPPPPTACRVRVKAAVNGVDPDVDAGVRCRPMPPRSAGPLDEREARRARLDREVIVVAAQRILADEGLGALTMRRIGDALGADPTAVYRHFRDKGELVIELADRAFASIPEPDPALPWPERLRGLLHSALGLYRTDPEFAIQLSHQPEDTPGLQRVAELALGALADAGLGPREQGIAYQLLTNYAVGSGLYMSQLTLDDWGPELIPQLRRSYAALPPEQYPNCVATAAHLWPDLGAVYERGVDLLIDAIEALASHATTKESP